MAKYLIFKQDNPIEVVTGWDTQYNPSLSTNEEEAARFDTETEALAMIENFEGGVDFWGTRPTRPK